MLNKIIRYFLENRLITIILLLMLVGWGLIVSPFNWKTGLLPNDPVPVDAIPNLGENQQIVFTKWAGRSPQDIEDQITYPLTTTLMGIPGVKTIRSSSMFGFSSIYVIFEEDVDFYWSRTRILEKLNSLPQGLLPDGVQPSLGPDATALGQIYWYTLEGRDKNGEPTGGWDLHELRSIQDYYVKYALSSAKGVSEVASVGGYVKEYQINVRPSAMKGYDVTLMDVMQAVKNSNLDVGARTLEINNAEYLVRGIGYIENLEDLEQTVVKNYNHTPIRIQDVARVQYGPASRRGMLDKSGAEAVGGVVVSRYGANPMEVIQHVKDKIREVEEGLPTKTLDDGTVSQVEIIPFYDRTELIEETIGTLEEALSLEILITIIVVIIMVMNLRASALISGVLPIAVLISFIAMKYMDVTANIVALSGIAIAIGTMVDMAIVLVENIVRHLDQSDPDEPRLQVIYRGTTEVASAVVTAVLTTIISFVPVFTMQGAEGKLFIPLAFTKTFALAAAIIVSILIIPTLAYLFFSVKIHARGIRRFINGGIIAGGLYLAVAHMPWAGIVIALFGAISLSGSFLGKEYKKYVTWATNALAIITVSLILAREWLPLSPEKTLFTNLFFVLLIIGLLLAFFALIIRHYSSILNWALRHKGNFLIIPSFILVLALVIWMGFNTIFGFIAKGLDQADVNIRTTGAWSTLAHAFPGVGEEFMPALDEGSFLLMPTSMPHSGIEENKKIMKHLDMAVSAIPEVKSVVGKAGRVESALDPAPLSMFENIITYKSEYITNDEGHRVRFRVNDKGEFVRDTAGNLIQDEDGKYYRQWRDHIRSPDDIWDEIVDAARYPGVTSAPKLQPIEARIVMLQSGMKAPMGIKVSGPDLQTIQDFGLKLEQHLKDVPGIKSKSVFADRVVGKPYLQIELNREKMARYGLSVKRVQSHLEVAVGGMKLTNTVEGRERYPVRVRYPRELRNDPDKLKEILIPTPGGTQIPLEEVAGISYRRGPQAIKSENTFLISYVIFDKKEGRAEVDVVNEAQRYLNQKIDQGALTVPKGVSYTFTGSYENQVRAEKRLSFVVPLVMIIIFLILYMQFRSIPTTLMVFSGVAIAFAGGFLMIWLYGQNWFMNFEVFDTNLRNLFQMKTVNLSIAVWVGFIALFGIATDNGVVLAAYLKQTFERNKPQDVQSIREGVLEAGKKRIRPTLMTTATTLLALLPILSSSGRGADVMIPMAIPTFGGMTIQIITLFVVPVLYAQWKEAKLKRAES
ncbi:MAG: efflux RND transporter permease subunit [Bacteroidales bacterium]|nr:efflux RND transporter permease subunit [Bacteroidales bacterium]